MNRIILAQLPVGQPVTVDEVDALIRFIAHFLIGISMVVAVIVMVISGILIMTGNQKSFENGKRMLKQAIWGSAVVLGVGVIINTIAMLVTRDFFCQVRVLGICLY